MFAARAAGLVAAVTNPAWEPGRDRDEQHREYVAASLEAEPRARVIKASDFTNNGVGLFHTTGSKLERLAGKYRPLAPVQKGSWMTTAARHGRKARKPLVVSVVLVDCLIYRGLRCSGDTPHHHQTVTHPLQPG